MKKVRFSFIAFLAIFAIMVTACNRTNGTTQQPTASETAVTQTAITTNAEDYARTLTEDLSDFAATWDNYSEENPIKVWGWSRDGKVGISEVEFNDTRGGIIITTLVFDADSHTVLWQNNIDSFNYGEETIPEKELAIFFNNFQNICRHQFGIEIQETPLIVPSESAMRHNGRTYNITINSTREEERMVRRYFVTAETDGKRKAILSKDTFLPSLPEFSSYSISPFEERALIIFRWASFSHSYGFEYAGCHLSIGSFPQNTPNPNFKKIDLLRYINLRDIEYPDQRSYPNYSGSGQDVQIDGFSRSGKVAFIVKTGIEGRGGTITDAYILDLIEDKIVYQNSIDDYYFYQVLYNYDGKTINSLYNLAYALFLSDYKEKSEQNEIVFSTVGFNNLPINLNNQLINITLEKSKVNKTFIGDESWRNNAYTFQYQAIAESGGKRKTITSGEEFAYDILLCGYFMSPFENRALVIIEVVRPDFEWYPEMRYIFAGCHLTSG